MSAATLVSRAQLPAAQRIVVKVGSSSLTDEKGHLDPERLRALVDVLAARRAAREEGLLIGISSGAALAGVAQKLPELGDNPRILTFNYDTGERYLSVPDFLPE